MQDPWNFRHELERIGASIWWQGRQNPSSQVLLMYWSSIPLLLEQLGFWGCHLSETALI
jgi:hypothetical protein